MKKENTKTVIDKVIETSTIRLSMDETRTLLRAGMSKNPITAYGADYLVGLGMLRQVTIRPDPKPKEVERLWRQALHAVQRRERSSALTQLDKIRQLTEPQEKRGYVLTELGKQVSRGITVRMNRQLAALRD